MRIGLNLLHAMPEIRGGWSYTRGIIQALAAHRGRHEYVAFVTGASRELLTAAPEIEPVTAAIDPRNRPLRIAWENSWLYRESLRRSVDCMHWFGGVRAAMTPVPAAVTVYDLHPFLDHAPMSRLKRMYLHRLVTATARSNAVIMPISESTAEGWRNQLGAHPGRIFVVPPVIDLAFSPADDDKVVAFRARHSLPDRFWLYVAGQEPNKNHRRLLEAFRSIRMSGSIPWPLVLRADPTQQTRQQPAELDELIRSEGAIVLPRLDPFEMPLLYSSATALVFPSLYEGAGLPVLEAMACGCPIIGSAIPAVKEFCREAANYFDPTDSASIAAAIIRFQNTPLDDSRRRRGIEIASTYSPAAVAPALLAAYEAAAGRRRAGHDTGTDKKVPTTH